MAKPTIMSPADWKRLTDVSKWHGKSNKKRSDELGNVDTFLTEYEKAPDDGTWPQKLRLLETCLQDWIQLKTNSKGELKTMRDHDTVSLLLQQIQAANQMAVPVQWSDSYAHIHIAQDNFNGDFPVPGNFSGIVDQALTTLASKPNGKQLLEWLVQGCGDKGHEVVIQYNGNKGGNQCAPIDGAITGDFRRRLDVFGGVDMTALLGNKNIVAKGKVGPDDKPRFVPNSGSNAVVKFNPNDEGEREDGEARGAFVALAHELVHAYHFVYGICARSPTGGTSGDQGGAEEEMRAVGALAYAKDPPHENWIRSEWGLSIRKKYSGNDFAGTTATLFK